MWHHSELGRVGQERGGGYHKHFFSGYESRLIDAEYLLTKRCQSEVCMIFMVSPCADSGAFLAAFTRL
ncbi:hypothetical protein SAMN05421510_101819 [Nitrosomonas ureae]|uniref:Uncharacterized protein n=1 Tax=Nitrosomonas ureae TaxID=44577 RepID=A0A1H9CZY6_9PROT|nr:hypothetical protein SAMN05421510_101819 [Nitrosomonas ureae]